MCLTSDIDIICFYSSSQCTTFDLLEKGMEVHIVADAVSSRRCISLSHSGFMSLCVRTCATVLSCLPPQSDRPVVCAVTTEAERRLPHHHRGRPPAAGSGCKTPQLQGGAACCIAALCRYCFTLHSQRLLKVLAHLIVKRRKAIPDAEKQEMMVHKRPSVPSQHTLEELRC